MKATTDGFSWREESGMERGGLRCRGVVHPRERNAAPAGHLFDVIVIGAGYSGLRAARDLTDYGRCFYLLHSGVSRAHSQQDCLFSCSKQGTVLVDERIPWNQMVSIYCLSLEA